MVDGAYQDKVDRIEGHLTTELDWDLLSSAEQQPSIASLVQGPLVGLIRNVENFNGYEALRQLLSNCQPNATPAST